MTVDPQLGVLEEARQIASPNFDPRPPGTEPSLIVVHGISLPPGEFGGAHVDALFTNRLDPGAHPYFRQIEGLKVSSHLYVRRHGQITQYVKFQDRAWHAGQSSFEGRPACNDYSIGIELEGTDTDAYEAAQYRSLAHAVAALCAAYPSLSATRVVGHSDIAPGRKTDPGPAFDWSRARRLIARALL